MKHRFERYCKDYKNIENYEAAKKDDFKGWCCHHKRETWNLDGERLFVDISMKELKALGMYWNVSSDELIFMKKGEHSKLHNKGNTYCLGKPKTTEHKQRLSEAHKGKQAGENNPMYGKKHSDESKKKMSRAANIRNTGKHWYNNSKENKFCIDCPPGFVPGRLIK